MQFSKNNNLLLYAIQLVCVLKWNKRESFQKNNNLLPHVIQLVCVLKWNNRDCFQKNKKKTTIYYSLLFNLCAYWNETRGTVFKKNQFITVCYSSCVGIEMKQEGQFSKKTQFITVCYSTCVCIEMKQEGSFQKNPIDDNMLLNSCAKWRGSFQKYQNNLLQ